MPVSVLADAIRTAWLPGINEVSGRAEAGIAGLLARQGFQVYSPSTRTSVTTTFSNWAEVAAAFAADAARMSSAAFETLENTRRSATLPRSTGWLIIRAYYGAFFAAHALARLLGRTIVQLDGPVTSAIDKITDLFGVQGEGGLEQGTYIGVALAQHGTVSLTKAGAARPHEALWEEFLSLLRHVGGTLPPGATMARAAAKLLELEQVLTDGGRSPRGNWLSMVRNRVNYQHALGTWFPYRERHEYYEGLEERVQKWRDDPETVSMWPHPGREMQRHIEACAMVVGLCRVVCLDMASRCPKGKSFQEFSAVALIRQLGVA